MAFNPTPSQEQAIGARGTILVSAAAGSGKTAVLTERVISRLLSETDPIDADRLLIVTFTNAAAAEMKSRIEKRLVEEREKDPANLRIQRQMLLMNNATVTTIDAFCIALVRENFDRLNIPPDFKIASDDTVAPISDRVLSELLSAEYDAANEDFFALLEALGDDYGEGRLRDMILKIHESCSSMPFPKAWRRSCVARYESIAGGERLGRSDWGRIILDEVAQSASDLAEKAEAALERARTDVYLQRTYEKALECILTLARGIYAHATAGDWDGVWTAHLSVVIPTTKAPTKKENIPVPADADEFKGRCKLICAAADKLVEGIDKRMASDEATQVDLLIRSLPVVQKLIALADAYDEKLLAGLLEKNLLTFAYTERLALSLFIDENGSPRTDAKALRDRFDEVLVDEYQDTNKLQDTLFAAISGGENLFMVGDVKQSIYRFRHADPDGFLEKKNRFLPYESADESSPRKIILGKNFRSRKSVCDFINHCFENWMRPETGGMEYGEEDRLIPGATFPENDGEDVLAVMLRYDRAAHSRAEAEALYIAEYIQKMMSAGAVIRDEQDKTKLRPARYGDFAILLRALAGKAEIYCETLRKFGIPVSAQSGNFFDSTEIVTFLSLLKTIANPTRDIPLASVMLSPIFAFTPNDLAKMRAACGEGSLYAAVRFAAENEDAKAEALLDKLKFYRDKSASMSVDRFLLFLLEDTGYLACATAMPDGKERRDRLLMLVDLAANSGERSLTLSEFCVRMDRLAQSGGPKTSPAVTGGDSVKIMTIHASKGLQFPVCILGYMGGMMNRSDMSDNLLISETLGIGLRYFDDAAAVRYSSVARDAIALSSSRERISEELRLLYVAMTRAEEKLVILLSGSDDFSKVLEKAEAELIQTPDGAQISSRSLLEVTTYAKWFYLLFATHPEYRGALEYGRAHFDGMTLITAEPCTLDETESAPPESAQPPAELVETLRERFAYKYPYAALNSIIAKTGASRLAEMDSANDYSFTAVPSFLSETGLTPAERGTAAHKFLQYAEFRAGVDAASELERLVAAGTLRQIEADAIDKRRMQRFFDSAIFARILKSPRVMREVRFLDELPASNFVADLPDEVAGEAVIVQGIADCVFEEDGALVILDYKTDRVDDMSELVARYSRQLKIYAAVCEKTYNMPVKECVIYSIRLGESIAF